MDEEEETLHAGGLRSRTPGATKGRLQDKDRLRRRKKRKGQTDSEQVGALKKKKKKKLHPADDSSRMTKGSGQNNSNGKIRLSERQIAVLRSMGEQDRNCSLFKSGLGHYNEENSFQS